MIVPPRPDYIRRRSFPMNRQYERPLLAGLFSRLPARGETGLATASHGLAIEDRTIYASIALIAQAQTKLGGCVRLIEA
jgi:hypothetical protein